MPARRVGGPQLAHDGFWRGLAGTLAAGLVLLAIVLAGAEALASDLGVAGPGASAVVGHLAAAVFAVAAASFADRREGSIAAIGVAASVLITSGTLWLFWWS
ncbi:MAG: hypothetical protein ACRDQ7_24295 [Haloechinothrix sp.]